MDPWTATLAFAKDVGFPAAVAFVVLKMLRDELREIARRLDDVIALLGNRRRPTSDAAPHV